MTKRVMNCVEAYTWFLIVTYLSNYAHDIFLGDISLTFFSLFQLNSFFFGRRMSLVD